jgi:hypothetical protein
MILLVSHTSMIYMYNPLEPLRGLREYVGTVLSLTAGGVVIFHIIDVASRVLMHCYVLAHGDLAAMARIKMTNGY